MKSEIKVFVEKFDEPFLKIVKDEKVLFRSDSQFGIKTDQVINLLKDLGYSVKTITVDKCSECNRWKRSVDWAKYPSRGTWFHNVFCDECLVDLGARRIK